MVTNKNKSRATVSRRRNPSDLPNVRRPRMRVGFDGQVLNGTMFSNTANTLANQAAAIFPVDCSNTSATVASIVTQSLANGLTGVTSIYNEYAYRSVRMEWMPFVSPGVADGGSQIYVSYVDNPEEVAFLFSGTVSTVFSTCKSTRNVKCFNAWERFVVNVPLTYRRKTFDVNNNIVYTTDSNDRSVQGAIIVGYNSPSAAVTLGQWHITYSLELRSMNTNQST
uniref:Capsid protein n=1 Tax=Riboviria sp. TaxID=2585031 RepID=A0A514D123_9VIRU|nr:MAG: hypothetical protein H3BulkLitter163859_000002 [Riboviria sp.]